MKNTIINNPSVEKLTYTVPEIAKLLGIGVNSAYTLVRSKGFPCIHIGRKIVIPKERFNTWLNSEQATANKEVH